jgi:hypothetical protein
MGPNSNGSHYRTEMLEPLSEWRRKEAGRAGRNLIIHADNARPHTAAFSQEFMEWTQNSDLFTRLTGSGII